MTGGRHITRQHVVSKVVLARFAVDGIVEIEDVRKPGRWRPKSPSAVGYVEDYVRHDSIGAEAVWQRTETLLATALNELDGGVVPEGGSRTEQAVKDCLALHWARSHSFKAAADKAWERVRRASIEDLAAARAPRPSLRAANRPERPDAARPRRRERRPPPRTGGLHRRSALLRAGPALLRPGAGQVRRSVARGRPVPAGHAGPRHFRQPRRHAVAPQTRPERPAGRSAGRRARRRDAARPAAVRQPDRPARRRNDRRCAGRRVERLAGQRQADTSHPAPARRTAVAHVGDSASALASAPRTSTPRAGYPGPPPC